MRSDAIDGPTLLTIGHSDHPIGEFLELLRRHRVDVVADVRSSPYSRQHAQFNRETLVEVLTREPIGYVFLGQELGARRVEPECYRGGRALYELICELPAFRRGLDELRRRLTSSRVCLLCAEKDPITCHRTILICRRLRAKRINIRHILADGALETMDAAETRLLEAVGLPQEDLFSGRAELVEQAYERQAQRIAYAESIAPAASGAVA